MEELPKELRYVTQPKSASYSNGNTDKKSWTRAWKHLGANKGRLFSSYNEPPKIPDSPKDAMKFLCRSWSPSSSDFLHTLSSSNVSSPRSAIGEKEEQEDNPEKALTNLTRSYNSSSNKKHCTPMDLTNTKERGKTLTTFLRSRKEKKREDDRFNTSKLHVALSLTQLAAAVSSFVSNGSPEAQDMGIAVASAAALMTTVWAETAELLGAQRNQVMSSINSGQAIQTPLDMVALTATAATCLRGAETLKSRAQANLSWSQEILKAGAQICALMPSGQKEYKWVTVYLKQEELILSFKKKYFGGALTTTKEYKAINVIEETMESQSCFCICLKTNKGMIKLLFQDEKQSTIWISTISKLLKMYNRI